MLYDLPSYLIRFTPIFVFSNLLARNEKWLYGLKLSAPQIQNYIKNLWSYNSFYFVWLQVPYEDLLDASELLIEALKLRWHYCQSASHSFPSTTSRFLRSFHEKNRTTSADFTEIETIHDDKKTVEGKKTWFFQSFDHFFPVLHVPK